MSVLNNVNAFLIRYEKMDGVRFSIRVSRSSRNGTERVEIALICAKVADGSQSGFDQKITWHKGSEKAYQAFSGIYDKLVTDRDLEIVITYSPPKQEITEPKP
ncbi:MAG: hypothetical protein COV07_01370 [Candidatus Vogelbacteria bacterium CG10_big_fil_rev_8_21_14_0_10_45_14]|uniref:Uncharacterized protein n=1 Tax=Candidatus Vogelbacteria bacterium CG10_big_fil_rev_8_21_14_0_10_45_14 TaxID=1975042 RepID=A0A2H0RKE7_9BACT|nr:MAG: hypothetical protein COV07_01370 [Candidatus Vogelbacteria bacterium CG10_big_fil_rev_8_21_14_0_10_45_14]